MMILLLSLTAEPACSQVLAQWRGENRDGIFKDSDLMKEWPDSGPEMIWFTGEIGAGFGSPAVTENRLFINGEVDSISHLFAFDLDGKLLWKVPNGKEFFGKDYSERFPGARSTPTVYGGWVYICSGNGRIACIDADSGTEKWAVDMVRDLGGAPNQFGYSESLVVDQKYVYCFPGGKEAHFAALDRITGKTVWTSPTNGDKVTMCSPFLAKTKDRRFLITLSREYLMAVDCQNGELLWSQKQDSVKLEGEHCNTPIFKDGFVYSVSGDKNGNGAVKLALKKDGTFLREEWRNRRVANAIGGFVLTGGYLYVATPSNKLMCLDLESGVVTDSLAGNRGSIIYADSMLYCYNTNGDTRIIQPLSNGKLKLVSRFKVTKGSQEHFSHPVISGGRLYIRHGKALMAYDIRKKK